MERWDKDCMVLVGQAPRFNPRPLTSKKIENSPSFAGWVIMQNLCRFSISEVKFRNYQVATGNYGLICGIYSDEKNDIWLAIPNIRFTSPDYRTVS
jgi:hypothetical protein